MAELLSPEHFLPHVNKALRVHGWTHTLTLTRVEVCRLDQGQVVTTTRPPFNVIFRGPPGQVLREGLYTLEVENGPSFDLYVIPIYTPILGAQDYQAAFN